MTKHLLPPGIEPRPYCVAGENCDIHQHNFLTWSCNNDLWLVREQPHLLRMSNASNNGHNANRSVLCSLLQMVCDL